MRHLVLVIPFALVCAASLATAQPPATAQAHPTTFPSRTVYQRCQETWAHACNIPDGRGGHYGTAQRQEVCSRLVFAPDGTFAIDTFGIPEPAGRYRILDGSRLRLDFLTAEGAVRSSETLPLSADRRTLGGMILLPTRD